MHRAVILTDETGSPRGTAEIVDAHTGKGKLHKAFSVYVLSRNRAQMLIQKRSDEKMLWPGIWANTCCSHPYEGESDAQAGMRRLREELGFSTTLAAQDTFVYREEDPGRGVEHEHVTILLGTLDPVEASVEPNPAEVSDWKWVSTEKLKEDMKAQPKKYAPWFHIGLKKMLEKKAD